MHIRPVRPTEHDALVDIWLRSVRATHTFLTEPEIDALIPDAGDALAPGGPLELWILAEDVDDRAVGFMGLVGSDVSALFLDPDVRRQGGGRALIQHAVSLRGPLTVEVNEQNPDAVRFYEAMGFRMIERTPTDGDGRPYPILRMAQTGG
ncbi:MAG TPA: GNAT family N-acetyltransferase [Candidatus Limnocylindrales bacterium]|nr:GNAT family N-acetyltransferase [Candidatus Limnocylindrales bacterium]